ncbi:hypothetical protein OIU84_019745 [Salix udensis]|uniref:Uncharacterized protein n=1 Tax=Salix udensis TaxID=889485 RepID=A0AAD6PJU0_9ROSI|nr:hypothetical protein OIU84_019745 [Salix udensis]
MNISTYYFRLQKRIRHSISS